MNPASEPTINANGSFTFPAWFAHRLLSCYYGSGPKADGAPSHSSGTLPDPNPPLDNTRPTPNGPSTLEGEFAGGTVIDLGAIPRGFKPMGFASKPKTPPIPDAHRAVQMAIAPEDGGGVTNNGH